MDNIEKLLNQVLQNQQQMQADIKELKSDVKDIKIKLDDLETKNAERHVELFSEIKDLRKDVLTIESVTAKNWGDIAKLKGIK